MINYMRYIRYLPLFYSMRTCEHLMNALHIRHREREGEGEGERDRVVGIVGKS